MGLHIWHQWSHSFDMDTSHTLGPKMLHLVNQFRLLLENTTRPSPSKQELATVMRLVRWCRRSCLCSGKTIAGHGKLFGFATTDVANIVHDESDRFFLQELVDHLRGRAGHPTCSSGLGRLDANASERHEDVAGGPCGDPHTP